MWDCKYKIGQDRCRLRGTVCFPGGKYCVLYGKFEFPLREDADELNILKKKKTNKKRTGGSGMK